jgi:hypothetical protein
MWTDGDEIWLAAFYNTSAWLWKLGNGLGEIQNTRQKHFFIN